MSLIIVDLAKTSNEYTYGEKCAFRFVRPTDHL
ncbi:MAG: hypothetical protein ACI8YC_001236, partial [Salibacteraceae bacterium]